METDLRRAASWLAGHGAPDATPSPLIAARLRVRRRSVLVLFVALPVIGVVVVTADAVPASETFGFLSLYLGLLLVGVLGQWLRLRALRLADRRLGTALRRRVTHPGSTGWRTVLGPRRLAVAGVMYGLGLALGLLDMGYARTPSDWALIATYLAGVTVLAALSAGEVADVVRRPAVAEDALSLAVDDVLRTEDAEQIVVTPVPAMLAVFASIALSRTPDWYVEVYLVMGVVAFAANLVARYAAKPSLRVGDRVTVDQ